MNLKNVMPQKEYKKYSETQIKILESAIDIISVKGYAGSSTSAIAKKAKIAEGTIFRYYKTKKELLLSISELFLKQNIPSYVFHHFKEALFTHQEDMSFETFITKAVYNRYQFGKDNLPLLKIFFQELLIHTEIKKQIIHTFKLDMIEPINQIFQQFKDRKEIINIPNTMILRFIISSVVGLIISNLIFGNIDEEQEYIEIDKTINFIIKGLKRKNIERTK